MNAISRFQGQTAIITGGGGEIGLATAKRLASEGAAIALLDQDPEKLESALAQLIEAGATAESFICDVTDIAAVEQALSAVIERFTSIEILFNNAGYQGAFSLVHQYPTGEFDKVIQVNVIGAFHVLKVVSAHMAERGYGRIVNTASMAGVQGPPNMAAYGASKFAVVGLTETAAKDLAPHGIRVNAISPAFIGPGFMWDRQVQLQAEAGSQYFSSDSEIVAQQMIDSVPMRRYGGVDEIPGTVSYLLSDDASYVTGINVPISGGIN